MNRSCRYPSTTKNTQSSGSA